MPLLGYQNTSLRSTQSRLGLGPTLVLHDLLLHLRGTPHGVRRSRGHFLLWRLLRHLLAQTATIANVPVVDLPLWRMLYGCLFLWSVEKV
jgi:hypothetical protein